ncbi:ENDD1 protein, partial [Cettia cetti]|nr:ENDD1 protein [Cettia cetti]
MLGLLLLQVLASCLWLGHSEVVDDFFKNCPQFFFDGIPPNDVLRPSNSALICQVYNNSYHFATLYNKGKRIPVYSAYIYQRGKCNRSSSWFVEPQLISSSFSKNMDTQVCVRCQNNISLDQIRENQAVTKDYDADKNYHRGHLNPCSHHNNTIDKTATNTLTNIVPQNKKLNQGAWKSYEITTMAQNAQNCKTTYVITGAVPGNNAISKDRVNIPSHIWSAACCLVGKKPKKAWGAIAENNDSNKVDVLTLGDLETRLSGHYGGRAVTLFHKACPRR